MGISYPSRYSLTSKNSLTILMYMANFSSSVVDLAHQWVLRVS